MQTDMTTTNNNNNTLSDHLFYFFNRLELYIQIPNI